ncbi:MAG: NUDIX domain-containing protein [Dehalococcoidia bacterium]|nr:MAG: NUDIX domain-containing protein [Dehalococcoidia bacterium]
MPLPLPTPAQHCPRCGAAFAAPAAGARCATEGCGYAWYSDPKVAVGVVAERDGRILLVRRNHEPALDRWAFPSGFVDAGEILTDAARRETREEAGVDVHIDRLLGVWSAPDDPVVFVAYAGTLASGDPVAGDEAREVAFFTPDALPPLAFDHDPEVIDAWRATRGDTLTAARPISLLQQRGIEADVLVPLIRRLEIELGTERAHTIARETIEAIARQQGRDVAAALGRADLPGFAHVKDSWGGAGGDLAIETLQQDSDRLEFNVVGCRFAEMYRRMGAADLGFLLSCSRDFALSEGYSAGLHLDRTQTIMQGAAYCDFRYRLAHTAPVREDARGGEAAPPTS